MATVTASAEDVRAFERDGYVVLRGLFAPDELAAYREHYMRLREAGPLPGDYDAAGGTTAHDPLRAYPRMIHMHLWDETSRAFLLDPRLTQPVTRLIGNDVYAVQTMLYFKPPGARGQAMHQDNFFIAARPGVCIAAWLALDRSDEETGCLRVVPGSHRWPILCTEDADLVESFTDVTVPLPAGTEQRAVEVEAGDVMFFHGSLVHGSLRNRSADRFRRSLIGHYVDAVALEASAYVAHAALRLDGTPAALRGHDEGGPCGVWVDHDGTPVVELSGVDPRKVARPE